MNLFYYIAILSSIAFIFPAIKQYKNKFFYYFLILAVNGVTGLIIVFVNNYFEAGIVIPFKNIFSSHLLIYSLHYTFLSKRINYTLLGFYFILSLIANYFLVFPAVSYYFILLHIIVVILLVDILIKYVNRFYEINLFHVVLVLYELTLIGKALAMVLDKASGFYFFILTNSFEIFLALYFSLFREDKPKFNFRLTNNRELIESKIEKEES